MVAAVLNPQTLCVFDMISVTAVSQFKTRLANMRDFDFMSK